MERRRRDGVSPGAAEVEAALDELEVRFLLDPDTTFDTDPGPGDPTQQQQQQ